MANRINLPINASVSGKNALDTLFTKFSPAVGQCLSNLISTSEDLNGYLLHYAGTCRLKAADTEKSSKVTWGSEYMLSQNQCIPVPRLTRFAVGTRPPPLAGLGALTRALCGAPHDLLHDLIRSVLRDDWVILVGNRPGAHSACGVGVVGGEGGVHNLSVGVWCSLQPDYIKYIFAVQEKLHFSTFWLCKCNMPIPLCLLIAFDV